MSQALVQFSFSRGPRKQSLIPSPLGPSPLASRPTGLDDIVTQLLDDDEIVRTVFCFAPV